MTVGCSSSKARVNTDPVDKANKKLQSFRTRAENYFQKGETFLANGDTETARFYFDRVIDVLMEAEPKEPASIILLELYINRIADLEMNALRELNEDNDDHKKLALNQVLSTPLFEPSNKEVSRFKEKVEERKPTYNVPVVINKQVVAFIKAYQTVRRENIQNALDRSVHYIDDFKRIFREKGVPDDLAYLPIIESGFRVQALSRARALGVWQFMAGTAKMFGLRVDWVVDERCDPYKSAVAAASLLKHLYDEYGDWYLALACYNGGPRRVKQAIQSMKTKDFFKLAGSRRYLRRETRNYVPAFLASLIIAKSPEEYGFTIRQTPGIFDNTKIVETPSPVSLKEMAKITGVSYKLLKEINPELVRDFTPFNKKFYGVRLPKEADETQLANLKRLPIEQKLFVGWYRVRRGDSLYHIARKFKTTVSKIKQTNKLRSNLIKPGKRLLIPRGF